MSGATCSSSGRTAPPGGEHDEQVRAWTNQVRLLAQDCNNCFTTYRYYGDPDIWWLPWFVKGDAPAER